VREAAAIALGRIARGQRRGGPVPPAPPAPPVPPRLPAVKLESPAPPDDAKAIARAQAELQRSLKELERSLR
jgi:hypothetical protein